MLWVPEFIFNIALKKPSIHFLAGWGHRDTADCLQARMTNWGTEPIGSVPTSHHHVSFPTAIKLLLPVHIILSTEDQGIFKVHERTDLGNMFQPNLPIQIDCSAFSQRLQRVISGKYCPSPMGTSTNALKEQAFAKKHDSALVIIYCHSPSLTMIYHH